ncbi:AMP-binding protein [Brucella sp. NBRC 12950]|uniref:AMP-binding protein n=1 Tax=Brucella sp. NBRC 12950 TaxID=2994518 RepID=UPI00255421FB|nr:AMP-binding protein [Brucella sp. NBRC 12950]
MAKEGHFLSIKPDGRQVKMLWGESLLRAWRIVAALRRDGVTAGSAIVLRLREAEEIVTAIHAGILGGYVILPMSARPEQLLPEAVTAEFPRIVDIDAAAFNRLTQGDDASCKSPSTGAPTDLRFGIPTSGTTGASRLVGLSDSASLARWWPRVPKASQAKGFLSWTSFDHVMGIGLAMPDLAVKVHLATQRFVANPLTWLDALVSTGATHATTTNFGLDRVVRALALTPDRRWDLQHIQRIGIGAETVLPATVEAALRALVPLGLREDALIAGYGLSECGPVVGGGTSLLPGQKASEGGLELDGPTAGHALRITNPDGVVLSEGAIGAIEVRGVTMTSGYIGDPDANSQLFTADHWLRTGDLGKLRLGKLTVTGREKELVVVNAKKYSCQEIEAQLLTIPGCSEIYAAPLSPEFTLSSGARCGIFIVCTVCPDPERVAKDVALTMAKAFNFVPARVSLISPDQVPRTALGKIRRLHLPDLSSPNIAYRSQAKTSTLDEFGALLGIWREILKLEGDFDADEDFFLLGGDSLMALDLIVEVERVYNTSLNLQDFAETLSLRNVSLYLNGVNVGYTPSPDPWLEKMQNLMQSWPGKPGLEGGLIRRLSGGETLSKGANLFWCAQTPIEAENLQETLGTKVNSFILRSGAYLFHYDTIQSQAAAEHYANEIQRLAPHGPLILGGNCQGATMMNEIIPLLQRAGREICLFIIADTDFPRLSKDEAFGMPVALIAMSGSRFNPQRWFKDPVVGLRKIAPKGLKLSILPGRYSETWQKPYNESAADLVFEAIEWSKLVPESEGLPAPLPLKSGFYNRTITSSQENLKLIAGQDYDLKLELTNTGNSVWAPYQKSGLAVGNHWLSTAGEILIWSDGREPLRGPLEPGEKIAITLSIRVPNTIGSTIIEVDLVEEGVRWFGEVNAPPLQIPVLVEAPAKYTPWWRALLPFPLAQRIRNNG